VMIEVREGVVGLRGEVVGVAAVHVGGGGHGAIEPLASKARLWAT
jgi:hypothetical protein